MCRMLLALQNVNVTAMIAAACTMAEGATGHFHERPDMRHDAGCGIIALPSGGIRETEVGNTRFHTMRSERLIDPGEAIRAIGAETVNLMAVHVRNSSFNNLTGLQYVHPHHHRTQDTDWRIMHNGSLPMISERLAPQERSNFDTLDYLRYIVPFVGPTLDAAATLKALSIAAADDAGITSANAFLFNDAHVYVIGWYPARSNTPHFYTLWRACTSETIYIASEPVSSLAPFDAWSPLPRSFVLSIDIPNLTVKGYETSEQ